MQTICRGAAFSSMKPDDGERMESSTIAESLAHLLALFRSGDPEGFAGLYRALGRGLYGAALRMLGRGEDAEEAMQETFLRFHAKGGAVTADQLSPWLHRVLLNVCLDRLRRAKRRPEAALHEDVAGAPSGKRAERLDLSRAVSLLPDGTVSLKTR